MGAVNKVILIGNLGADPEVRDLEGGAKVATCSIATSEKWKDKNGEKQESTEWHRLVFWRGLAEVVEKYLKKGSSIYIEGKLRTRSYENKDGVKTWTTEIEVRELQMLGGRPEGGNNSAPAPTEQPAQTDTEKDDLPF